MIDLVPVGKKIIFGTASGVSFNGDIALCSDEVSVQWEKVGFKSAFH